LHNHALLAGFFAVLLENHPKVVWMNMETFTPPMLEQSTFLHKNIRFLRKQIGLSQEELALSIGLNRGNIASYENGSAEPKVCNLLRISNLFKVSICDLAKRDLSEDNNFRAKVAFDAITSALPENTCLDALTLEAQDLQKMIEGLSTCSRLKINQLRENAPSEYRLIISNLEEMSNTARILSERYLFLLQHINCKDKTDHPSNKGC
jgi:transcriptional regulator with XRE-family HTH domain